MTGYISLSAHNTKKIKVSSIRDLQKSFSTQISIIDIDNNVIEISIFSEIQKNLEVSFSKKTIVQKREYPLINSN